MDGELLIVSQFTLYGDCRKVDTSSISNAQEITFDSAGNGAKSGLIDPDNDTDYFKMTLSEATDLVIGTTGLVYDTIGALLDSERKEITSNDDGLLWPSRLQFLIRTRLDAGTYYIKVWGWGLTDTGLYTLHVNTVAEPGDTPTAATPLLLSIAGGGRIDPSSDEDYFRFDIPARTMDMHAVNVVTVRISLISSRTIKLNTRAVLVWPGIPNACGRWRKPTVSEHIGAVLPTGGLYEAGYFGYLRAAFSVYRWGRRRACVCPQGV